MARENPEASEERSDSGSESGSETVTVVSSKRANEEEISDVESKKRRIDEDWFEKSFVVKAMTSFGVVSEYSVKERWSMVDMETKKIIEEKYRVLQEEEMRLATLKAKIMCDVASALAKVVP